MQLASNFVRKLSKNVLFLLLAFLLPVLVFAQSPLPGTVSNTVSGGSVDYTIPSNITQINITLSGAEGGGGRSASCEFRGGLGATISASFSVGFCSAQSLVPGGLLRLITGSQGGFSSLNQKGAGGGGGSALLYKAPQSTDWIILAAAGGGGGAYFFVQSCAGANGGDAQLGENGGSTAVSGGTGGNGGNGGGIISFGGGGAFGDGYTLGNTACSGKAGFPNGAAGGNCGGSLTTSGGYGFGSGAAGVDGGGGGGGYSGGAGGNSFSGGAGGGSFISTRAMAGSTSITADRRGNGTISIISTTGTVAQPVSLASTTLNPISVTACNAISFAGSGAAYAYSTFPVEISLRQFNAAGGVINTNSCNIQSIKYADAEAVITSKTIYRTFTVTDINNASATCTQVITLDRPPLSASISPAEQTVCVNAVPALISIDDIVVSSPLAIQWFESEESSFALFSATSIPGENSATYSPPASNTAGDKYYYARITDQCGNLITLRSTVTSTQAQEWVLDQDVDGYYTGNVVLACSSPGVGYFVKSNQQPGDCDDGVSTINPGATEVYDGEDNNCDGAVDEGITPPLPANITSASPGYQDYVIPADITSVSLNIQGAKGGSFKLFNSRFNITTPAGDGGLGRTVNAMFVVDPDCQQALKPGGILRLIVGATPAEIVLTAQFNSFPEENLGQGGGGGSAILYQAPGSTEWVVLVVAGGGGGAATVYTGDAATPKNGLPGISETSDANTGQNTMGGKSAFTTTTIKDPYDPRGGGIITTTTTYSGGGGGMLGDATGSCGGSKGLDAGADGGTALSCNGGRLGGVGFGAGGSGINGGGGGGGYSGGNGGVIAMGGYGAGSFSSGIADQVSTQNGSDVENGLITITTGTTATSTLYPDLEALPDVTGECSAAVTTTPTATDICGGIIQGTTTDDLTYTSQGTYIITWTFSDGNGNSTTQEQKVIVNDVTDPVPDLEALPDVTGECSATVTTTPTATDICGGIIQGTTTDDLTYTSQGTYIITWTFSDGNGNSTTQEQKVIVNDVTDPVPDLEALPDVTGECSATVTTTPTATDICGGIIQGTTTDDLTYTSQGTYIITWTFSDGNGNSTTQEQKVIVDDVTKPTLIIPSDKTISCEASVLPSNTGNATATDNCDGDPVVTYSDVSTKGSNAADCNFYTYKITRTWKAVDAAGNITLADQVINVADNSKPVITCVSQPVGGFKRGTNTGLCTYKVVSTEFDAIATDNCSSPLLTWSITGATTLNGSTTMAGTDLNFGINNIVWTATDACGNMETCAITVDVNSITTTINVMVTPNEIQYSDKVTFTASVTPSNCAIAGPIGGKVTFKMGNLVMGEANININGIATLANVPVLEDMLYDTDLNNLFNATDGPLKPGSKTVTAVFSGTDADYVLGPNPTTSLKVNCEDVDITYNGQQYFTANPNSNTGTVVLSSYLPDPDDTPLGERGDIRNATVTFRDGGAAGPILGTSNIPAGLVNPGITTEGIASTSFDHTLTNSDISSGGKIFDVWTGANNYYCGETGGDLIPVTVALPGQEFVTGGGYIIMQNSAGTYAGTPGKRMNFGLVMKWNKSGKNLQGKVNVIYRKLVNGVYRIYQIRSNAISSLAVLEVNDNGQSTSGNNITFRKAIISTKANLTDVTDPLNPVSLGGGYSLSLEAWESTTLNTGALDRISVQLSGSGSQGLLFSSNWSRGKSLWQTLNGGKIQVRNNVTTTVAPITQKSNVELQEAGLFDLRAYPNPSSSQFKVQIQSSNNAERVHIRVIDISGRTVQKFDNLNANETFNIGETYRPGMYIVEMVQGNNRKQLKLIKQPD